MSVVAWLVFVTPVCLIYSVDARKTDNPTNEMEGVGNSVTTFAELEAIRNKIFNSRISKIGDAYIQELKGEAFINIK